MIKAKGWVVMTAATLAFTPQAASAQVGAEVERIVERIGAMVERAAVRMDRLLHRALEDGSDFRVRVVEEQQGSFDWSGRVDRGDVVEIKGVNGVVRAGPASGSRVEVRAVKSARRSDPDDVRIEVVEHDRGVTVCAVYPTLRGERTNQCVPGEGGRMNTRNNDVEVRFEVRVPDGALFVGRTVNGDVEALDLGEDVRVSTVNGDVEVTTSGFAEASTVNGSIRARMEGRPFGQGVSFRTVNGSITLDLPDDVDADLEAEWVNGGLDTEIPFLVQGRMSRRHAAGTLGDGGPPLKLETVNGSIRIR